MSLVHARAASMRRIKSTVLGVFLLALGSGGCKTQDDAVAAASQMAETSKTLSAYYTALSKVVSQTQNVYQAQYVLQGLPPMDLSKTLIQIRARADMALEIGKVSEAFGKISGSKEPKEAAAAATNLNAELVTVNALSSNDAETKAVTQGVQAIVSLLQQHDEVAAAKQISPLCHNLSVFFDSEKGLYDSLNETYLLSAQSVAKDMVRKNQVDVSPVFASALQPFSLEPRLDQKTVAEGMQKYLSEQIDARYKSKVADGRKATEGLSDALKEMDKRVATVVSEKPLTVRLPPLSLANAESWIKSILKGSDDE
jgi:hypothetical protein